MSGSKSTVVQTIWKYDQSQQNTHVSVARYRCETGGAGVSFRGGAAGHGVGGLLLLQRIRP